MPHSLNPHAGKVDVSYGINITQKVLGIEIQMLAPLMSDKTKQLKPAVPLPPKFHLKIF